MSFVHGSNGRIYVNGFDLSSFLKEVSSSEEVAVHDTTGFGAVAKSYFPGLADATLSAEGLFAGAIDATHAVFSAALRNRAPDIWTWMPSGDIDGVFGYGLSSHVTSYEVSSPVDDLVTVSVEAQSNVGLCNLQVLAPLAIRNTTTNGTSRDNTLLTTAGGEGYLQVTTVTGGTPNLAARVQHSVDAAVWVDLVTFAAVTASNTAQRIEVAGTVNRHTRAIWTITGTTPNFTFQVAFGRN